MQALVPIINKRRDDIFIQLLENIRNLFTDVAFINMDGVEYTDFSDVLEAILHQCGGTK